MSRARRAGRPPGSRPASRSTCSSPFDRGARSPRRRRHRTAAGRCRRESRCPAPRARASARRRSRRGRPPRSRLLRCRRACAAARARRPSVSVEAEQLGAPLDADAEAAPGARSAAARARPGERSAGRERAQSAPDGAEGQRVPLRAAYPEIDRRMPVPALDHRIGQAELPVELERARLHGERPRGGARLGALVDRCRTRTPRRASHSASTRPVGPAPTISTVALGTRTSASSPSRSAGRRHLQLGAARARAARHAPLRRLLARPRARAVPPVRATGGTRREARAPLWHTLAHGEARARRRRAGRLLLRGRAVCADFAARRSRP